MAHAGAVDPHTISYNADAFATVTEDAGPICPI
jgi:hypothetical protein